MLFHARQAVAFIDGMSEDAFRADLRTRFAVQHALQIIGEAARALPLEITDRFQSIPWRKIVGMRNVLVHDYLGVDPNVVFDTARHFVPDLIGQLPTVIAEIERDDSAS
jgi:uncharacterized protein with HEPN domain